MASIDEFIDFLGKYCGELSAALQNESQKRRALLSGDPGQLELMLQLQQAETMKIQNLEARRIELQKALGFEGLTAKMLVDAVTEPALRQRLADVLQEISTLASDIQEQNRMSMEFANSSLKMMEQVAISAGIESHSTYSPDTPRGATHSKDSSFEKLV